MRVRAHDDVGARLHQHLRQRLLQRVGAGVELGPPVQVDDDRVGRLAGRLDRRDQVVDVIGRGQARLGGGGGPGRLQVRVDDLGGGDDGDVLRR